MLLIDLALRHNNWGVIMRLGLKSIWTTTVVRIAILGLILVIASTGLACAESDDFDFKPRETGCNPVC